MMITLNETGAFLWERLNEEITEETLVAALLSEHDGKVSGFLQETMEKLPMVQAMDVPPQVESRNETLMGDRYRVQRKRKNISLVTHTGINVMYYGAQRCFRGCNRRFGNR